LYSFGKAYSDMAFSPTIEPIKVKIKKMRQKLAGSLKYKNAHYCCFNSANACPNGISRSNRKALRGFN
jgi:hypothetical protein